MPYRYTFSAPGEFSFACSLQCQQCGVVKADGSRCRNRVCVGVPYCHVHLFYKKHLKIKPSTIPGAGKGLFAARPNAGDDIVFRRGDVVVEYGGESIDRATLDHRYGRYTAPYGLQRRADLFENAACKRGAGSLANHKPLSQANARYSVGRDRMNLVATKNIRNGQEIFCCYTGAARSRGAGQYRFDEGTTGRTARASRAAAGAGPVRQVHARGAVAKRS